MTCLGNCSGKCIAASRVLATAQPMSLRPRADATHGNRHYDPEEGASGPSGLAPAREGCFPSVVGIYSSMYRLGYTPWERYGSAAASSIAQRLDREAAERATPGGRALDLGCGRGQYTPELARRAWEVVGVDYVPRAIEAARRKNIPGATFMVGDVSDLPVEQLGRFDFFLDIGCFQHLDAGQRLAAGRGITALANPGATLLMMQFSRLTPIRPFMGGVTPDEVEAALPGWRMLNVEDAETAGLGWPMSRMQPQWLRLRRQS